MFYLQTSDGPEFVLGVISMPTVLILHVCKQFCVNHGVSIESRACTVVQRASSLVNSISFLVLVTSDNNE